MKKRDPKRYKDHAERIPDATIGSRYRQHGSTHQSVTKDHISRQPHKRARQEAKAEIEAQRVTDFRTVTITIATKDFLTLTPDQKQALTFFFSPLYIGDFMVWRQFPVYRLEELGVPKDLVLSLPADLTDIAEQKP